MGVEGSKGEKGEPGLSVSVCHTNPHVTIQSINLVFLCVQTEEVKELVTKEVVEKCGKCVHVLPEHVLVLVCTYSQCV